MQISFKNPIVNSDLEAICANPLPWHRFEGKSVLITGAGGLVGSYLVWTLLAQNARLAQPVSVIAAGRDLTKLRAKLGNAAHLEFVEIDLSSSQPPPTLHADFIIHAASPSRTSIHREDPLATLSPNVFGTQALLEIAYRSSCEGFLFVSSGAVYGQPALQNGQRVTETTAGNYPHLNAAMSYAESKRMGEFLCTAWARQHGVPACSARLGHTYGPGLEETDERIFADFVFRILKGESLVIQSAGAAVRPFCYITDAITGLFTILLQGLAGEAYNLINPYSEYSILELARELDKAFPERHLDIQVLGKASHSFQTSILLSSEKLEALGWRPTVSVHDGFRRTVESYGAF